MKKNDIIQSSNTKIAKYSSDIVRRGLSLATSINNHDLDFCV